MSTIYAVTLIMHIAMGLVGIVASYAVVLHLLKKEVSIKKLKCASLTAFAGYLLSWFAGGYYYVLYYGGNVKPVIKEGDYAWAHLVVMEAKEHIFLMLPFATLAVAAVIYFGSDKLQTDAEYKKSATYLAIVVSVIATGITLAGIIISGGAQ